MHAQSENDVHHVATVDKCFHKTQNRHGQWVVRQRGVRQYLPIRDGKITLMDLY